MLALTLIGLFGVVAIATGLSLVDTFLRARGAFRTLQREHRLLKAGFVPQVHAHELRLRSPARRTLPSVGRPHVRRLPVKQLAG